MTCSKCELPGSITMSRVKFCAKHYRIQQMRHNASAKGKTVPSRELLLSMVAELERRELVCEACERKMNWLREDGASTIVTLQHDRDGGYRLICSRCNARHRLHPGDSFYDVPPNHKYCPGCRMVLHVQSFHADKRTVTGLQSQCAECKRTRLGYRPRGSAAGWAKLTLEQANEVKRRLLAGERTASVAGEFGITPQHASRLKAGTTWRGLLA